MAIISHCANEFASTPKVLKSGFCLVFKMLFLLNQHNTSADARFLVGQYFPTTNLTPSLSIINKEILMVLRKP